MKTLAAALAVVAAALLLAAPAGAHGGEASFTQVMALRTDTDAVQVTAELVYRADGHGVPDATVTAVVDGGTPVALEPSPGEEGLYVGTIDAPGGATIRVTSVDPAATGEAVAPEEAAAPSSTEGATSTTAAETTTTALPPATTEVTPTDAASDDGDDGLPVGLVGAGAVVVLAAVVAGVVLVRRTGDAAE